MAYYLVMLKSVNDAPYEISMPIKEFWPQSEWDNAASISFRESGWNWMRSTTRPVRWAFRAALQSERKAESKSRPRLQLVTFKSMLAITRIGFLAHSTTPDRMRGPRMRYGRSAGGRHGILAPRSSVFCDSTPGLPYGTIGLWRHRIRPRMTISLLSCRLSKLALP